jgi:APA family basic amino acid/polyamine antiporter
MAQDGLFFKKASQLNKYAVPGFALWIQCLVACILCLSGKYGDLLTMVSFVVVIFYVLTILGIFGLRKKRPDAERPYKAFGYPILPGIYIILALAFCVGLVTASAQSTKYSLWGLGIALLGIPLYYFAVSRQKK